MKNQSFIDFNEFTDEDNQPIAGSKTVKVRKQVAKKPLKVKPVKKGKILLIEKTPLRRLKGVRVEELDGLRLIKIKPIKVGKISKKIKKDATKRFKEAAGGAGAKSESRSRINLQEAFMKRLIGYQETNRCGYKCAIVGSITGVLVERGYNKVYQDRAVARAVRCKPAL